MATALTSTVVANPPFREDLLVIIHDLVDLPISHGLIKRMKQLETLLVHFESREFTYTDYRGAIPASLMHMHQMALTRGRERS